MSELTALEIEEIEKAIESEEPIPKNVLNEYIERKISDGIMSNELLTELEHVSEVQKREHELLMIQAENERTRLHTMALEAETRYMELMADEQE